MKQFILTLALVFATTLCYCQATAGGFSAAPLVLGNTRTGVLTIATHQTDPYPNISMFGSQYSLAERQGWIIVNNTYFRPGGGIAIGTEFEIPLGFQLALKGKMICEEVHVKLKASWPDYVFDKGYKLKPLSEVADFVKKNKHLPEIPSATEVEKDGFGLASMNEKLLKKVEELTLYLIEQDKKIKELEGRLTKEEKK